MRLLVLGGTQFLGRRLVEEALRRGANSSSRGAPPCISIATRRRAPSVLWPRIVPRHRQRAAQLDLSTVPGHIGWRRKQPESAVKS